MGPSDGAGRGTNVPQHRPRLLQVLEELSIPLLRSCLFCVTGLLLNMSVSMEVGEEVPVL